MSLEELRPYFVARLKAVDPDFVEWKDGFNSDNVPDNVLDRTFFVDFSEQMVGAGQNMQGLNYECPIKVRCWFRGFSYPAEAIDRALVTGEAIIKECLKHTNRLTQLGIKNVVSTSLVVSPIDASNDNVVKLELGFTCLVKILID